MGTGSLLESWLTDIAALAPQAGPERWRAEGELLVAGWSEPHRHYHTLEHLAEVVAALDELRTAGEVGADQARVCRIAGWYHDLAYDPRAQPGSNEHRSATQARDHLHRLGVDPDVVDQVEQVVLMTADHQGAGVGEPATRHTRVLDAFHDADLWILSAPEARFDAYCAQVRQEYEHVPPQLYAAGRATILRRLVDDGPVYRTAHAQGWQGAAVTNVARELARLAG